jgi:hypothetical protein
MPRRKRYKGLIEFTIRDGFMSPGRRGNATITLHATEGPYEGYINMPNCVLYDRPEITGETSIPCAVWWDDRLSREAAELYGVIKNLHKVQAEILEASGGKDTMVITRPLIEEWMGERKRTVQAWLQELVETSHVTRVPGYRGIRSNYTLNSS